MSKISFFITALLFSPSPLSLDKPSRLPPLPLSRILRIPLVHPAVKNEAAAVQWVGTESQSPGCTETGRLAIMDPPCGRSR